MFHDVLGNKLQITDFFRLSKNGNLFKGLWFPRDSQSVERDSDVNRRVSGAANKKSCHTVLVKQLLLEDSKLEVESTLREISLVTGIQHSSFVRVHACLLNTGLFIDAEETKHLAGDATLQPLTKLQPSLYIIESFVDGCSVSNLIGYDSSSVNGQLRENVIAAITYDTLRGLKYLHDERQLVHRHITTENLLLDSAQGKVIISHLWKSSEIVDPKAGCLLIDGSIGYIAPEVFTAGRFDLETGALRSYSYSADIWSLGICVLEMTLGVFATQKSLIFSRCLKHLTTMSCSAQTTVVPTSSPLLGVPNTQSSHHQDSPFDIHTQIQNPQLVDFLACCLRIDAFHRPSAKVLLKHPFLLEQKIEALMERTRIIAAVARAAKESQPSCSIRTRSSSVEQSRTMSTNPSTPKTVPLGLSSLTAAAKLPPECPLTEEGVQPCVTHSENFRGDSPACGVRDSEKISTERLIKIFFNVKPHEEEMTERAEAKFHFITPTNLRDTILEDFGEKKSGIDFSGGNMSCNLSDVVEKTLAHSAALSQAIQGITAKTWQHKDIANRIPYSFQDFDTIVNEQNEIENLLTSLTSSFQEMNEEFPHFGYAFSHLLVRQLMSNPNEVQGLRLLAKSFEGIAEIEEEENTRRNQEEALREDHGPDTQLANNKQRFVPTMPLHTSSDGDSQKKRCANASAFLYNKWLKHHK